MCIMSLSIDFYFQIKTELQTRLAALKQDIKDLEDNFKSTKAELKPKIDKLKVSIMFIVYVVLCDDDICLQFVIEEGIQWKQPDIIKNILLYSAYVFFIVMLTLFISRFEKKIKLLTYGIFKNDLVPMQCMSIKAKVTFGRYLAGWIFFLPLVSNKQGIDAHWTIFL